MNNDTSGEDLDEHVVLGLTWPAEMMRIPPFPSPAKPSFRRAQISSTLSRLAPASNAAAAPRISRGAVTQPLNTGVRRGLTPRTLALHAHLRLQPPSPFLVSFCPQWDSSLKAKFALRAHRMRLSDSPPPSPSLFPLNLLLFFFF